MERGKAQARPRPSLARRSRGGRVKPSRATTTTTIGFPRAERVFDEDLGWERTRSCAPVLLLVSSPLGSMKEKGLLQIAMFKRGRRGGEVGRLPVPGVGGRRHRGTRFTEVVATHTSCLTAWSRNIQDETGLVRYEGCDMGEIVPRERKR